MMRGLRAVVLGLTFILSLTNRMDGSIEQTSLVGEGAFASHRRHMVVEREALFFFLARQG